MADPKTPADPKPEDAAALPDPTGPFVHLQNHGKQNLRIGGRFLSPKGKCILRGTVPDGVCVVDATGAVVARLPAAEVRMLAQLHSQGALWLSDDAYLVTAAPAAPAPSGVGALSW